MVCSHTMHIQSSYWSDVSEVGTTYRNKKVLSSGLVDKGSVQRGLDSFYVSLLRFVNPATSKNEKHITLQEDF